MSTPLQPNLQVLLESRDFLRSIARDLLRDEHRADDIVQQAFLKALEKPPTVPKALRAWLVRVVRNLCIDSSRRETMRPERERFAAEIEVLKHDEEMDLALEHDVVKAVRALRQPYRSAVYLRYYRSLSPQEIADQLHVPVATVKTRLRRGLGLLREQLDREYGGRRQWAMAMIPIAAAPWPTASAPWTFASPAVLVTAAVSVAILTGIAWHYWPSSAPDVMEYQASTMASAGAPESSATLQPRITTADLPPQANQEAGGILGQIVDELGRPLPDVHVEAIACHYDVSDTILLGVLKDDPTLTQVTDEGGKFRLSIDSDSSYLVTFRAPGYSSKRIETAACSDHITQLGTISLRPGFSISGQVLDSQRMPIANATVELETEEGLGIPIHGDHPAIGLEDAVTDADGQFRLNATSGSSWKLAISHPLFPHLPVIGSDRKSATGLELVMPSGHEIRGTLQGFGDLEQRPVWVMAIPKTGPTASYVDDIVSEFGGDREWRMERAEPSGLFTVRGLAKDQDYYLIALARPHLEGQPLSRPVIAQPNSDPLTIATIVAQQLRFQVTDAVTGEPVEDMVVYAGRHDFILWGYHSWLADHQLESVVDFSDGWVSLDIPPGLEDPRQQFHFRIEADGYAAFVTEADSAEELSEQLALVQLQPAPVATIHVQDTDGQPIQDAGLRLTSSEKEASTPWWAAVTGASGTAAINTFPGSESTLEVYARGFAPLIQPGLELPLGDFERTVTLKPGGQLEVRVVDSENRPQPRTRVELRSHQLDTHVRMTDASGITHFHQLNGEYEIRVVESCSCTAEHWSSVFPEVTQHHGDSALANRWQPIQVNDGESAEIQLERGAIARVAGTLLTADHRPIADATIRVVPRQVPEFLVHSHGWPQITTDELGKLSFDQLESGLFNFWIYSQDQAMPTRIPVALSSGLNMLDLHLQSAWIDGTVLDKDGDPVVGAVVRVLAKRNTERDVLFRWMYADSAIEMATAETDDDGDFLLPNVAIGTEFRLKVEAAGYGSTALRVPALAADEYYIVPPMTLPTCGTIEVEFEIASFDDFCSSQHLLNFTNLDEPDLDSIVELVDAATIRLDSLREGQWQVELWEIECCMPHLAESLADKPTRRAQTVVVNSAAPTNLMFDLR